jgi:H+/Cl- antiporter ClcA
MKTKLYLYGSAISGLIACLCVAPARRYASSAYTLWLSQQPADTLLVHSAARANHLWAAAMLAFVLLAAGLLAAGWRSRRRGASMRQAG